MEERLFSYFMALVIKTLSEETLRELADRVIDFVEEKVVASEAKWDNAVILPLCDVVRRAFNVED